ncbi:alpha/beta fold hydrolase [Novosphingobium sp. JCM 18896]|uniref:alpha/beta fold hydrolase n=1 Tax=Novosphingobium sp. JCM 18896 TaxID=2989731 RepID=UPI0022229B10|nr:alpha/beta fold hydrolase [Novosphingobium sp. JCM 18896]MCW1431824.1 alpha/beta fold hydrolase [Novosphingobium sp. JCM 18896]
MACYVLVHGGAHGGWCWDRVRPILTAAGHEVHALTLTGLGERASLLSPETTLATHIADIVEVIEQGDLADVILVGHSYGGMVITGVADKLPGRISEMVYLDAAIPFDGEALVDWSPALRQLAANEMRVVDGVELVLFPDAPSFMIYGVTDPSDQEWLRSKLTPHPWQCFIEPLKLSDGAAVRALPRTNINAPSTLRLRKGESLERSLDADRVWSVDTGHDMMVTEPHRVAELLMKLAGESKP